MDKIRVENLKFTDEKGRTRLFNGMNIDDKLIDRDSFRYNLDDEFFKKFRMYGLDFIRLAVTWQNLEPRAGEYNESYLKSIDGIFERAAKHGVYILLDLHQDLYSGFDGVGGGDGAPGWACMSDGLKMRNPRVVWVEGYLLCGCTRRCFDHFWNNDITHGMGLQDRFALLWRMLAERYGGSPALFGFDLLNEPFPGSPGKKMIFRLAKSAAKNIAFNGKLDRKRIIKSAVKKDMRGLLDSIDGSIVPDIMCKLDSLQAEFDIKVYSPFLNRITKAIREVTPNGIIMMEQSFLCNGGARHFVPPVTVDGKREEQQCFGPHSYDIAVDTPLYKYANAGRVKAFFNEMRSTQLRLNVPVVVGEWGGCSDNKDTSWFGHGRELLNYFDENRWSQSYWDYHGDDMDAPLMDLLSRTHPVAVGGEITAYGYDYETDVFTLEFISDGKNETLIYAHKPFEAPEGFKYKTVEAYENGARVIAIKPGAGECAVTLNFKN